ncbi:MAG: hypothetical protein GY804_09045 [Alphaproteobacteria bacterium]|nr:hypothetical protein [Alphaproteobacteria bacterium]
MSKWLRWLRCFLFGSNKKQYIRKPNFSTKKNIEKLFDDLSYMVYYKDKIDWSIMYVQLLKIISQLTEVKEKNQCVFPYVEKYVRKIHLLDDICRRLQYTKDTGVESDIKTICVNIVNILTTV